MTTKQLLLWIIGAIITACLGFIGFGLWSLQQIRAQNRHEQDESAKRRIAQVAVDTRQHNEQQDQPPQIAHQVTTPALHQGPKCSLEIALEQPIEESELQRLARELKGQCAGAQQVFITYWLPHQKPGKEPAWATTHFTPTLAVKIWGQTPSQIAQVPVPKQDDRVLGAWHDSLFGCTVTLTKAEKGKAIMRCSKGDGKDMVHTLAPLRSKGKNTWKYFTWDPHREWVRIAANGDLELGKKARVFRTMPKR